MRISVIVCTHNPRFDYLQRTIESLRQQDFPASDWELLIIDNKSDKTVAGSLDLSWHKKSKVIRGDKIGLTNARICGINNAKGEIFIFVDDDNILQESYLSKAYNIFKKYQFMGAWGGKSIGEFEATPPDWFEKKHYEMLAVRDVERDVWSNLFLNWETTPIGAGLVVRREVGEKYAEKVRSEKRFDFDRKGDSLIGGGDNDIVCTACEVGFTAGRFKDLQLTHLISKDRLTLEHMIGLTEATAFSSVMLYASRNMSYYTGFLNKSILGKMLDVKHLYSLSFEKRQLIKAERRGIKKALKSIESSEDKAHGE